jgi:hypothetical protein
MMSVPAMIPLAAISGCVLETPPPDFDPAVVGGRWRSLARGPVPLHESAAAVSDSKLYYAGGRLPSERIASLYRYDPPPVDTWTQLAPFPGEPVDRTGAVGVDGTLFAFGAGGQRCTNQPCRYVDCGGVFNGADIDAFFLAPGDRAAYATTFPDCDLNFADMNGDRAVNGADIDPFFDCLGNGNCP